MILVAQLYGKHLKEKLWVFVPNHMFSFCFSASIRISSSVFSSKFVSCISLLLNESMLFDIITANEYLCFAQTNKSPTHTWRRPKLFDVFLKFVNNNWRSGSRWAKQYCQESNPKTFNLTDGNKCHGRISSLNYLIVISFILKPFAGETWHKRNMIKLLNEIGWE